MFQGVFDFALDSARVAWRDAVAELESILIRDGAISRATLGDVMARAFGGTDASGAYSPKFAYDCAEGALVGYLRRIGLVANGPLPCDLRAYDLALPTQARRVGRTELYQQYSTPVSVGWLAARAAKISPSDLVLEPSAGTGMLAVHAANAGARLALNEIDPERRAILGALGDVSDLDAYNLAALYSGERPSVVLMNPPFTLNAKSLEHASAVGFHHVEQALALLRVGGRLVAILGDGAYEKHFERLAERGTIVARMALGGSAFAKMGVHFETQLIVVDSVATSGEMRVLPAGASLEQMVAFIDSLPARRELDVAAIVAPTTRTIAPATTSGGRRKLASGVLRRVTEPPVPLVYDALPASEPEAMTDSVFETYRPRRIRFADAKPHPTPLVESVALASVNLPEPTYVPLLPPDLVRDGLLSEAQLEAIVYAGAAHSTMIELPDMRPDASDLSYLARRAFMIGDGGGVGKTNTNFGIILDNFARGRRKALVLSDRQSLEQDAIRYWAALGGNPDELVNANNYPLSVKIDLEEGILFSTYATLRSASKTLDRTRLEQFMEWLGEDFDGVIILDEAHGLMNAASEKSERGRKAGSKQGALALELQSRVPNARIVYSSATSATRLSALSYAPRLGLWGRGTAFFDRDTFMERMAEGGLAAMEVVCRDLKSMGLYVARTLSMDGVTYERLTHALTDAQRKHYEVYCDAWKVIGRQIDQQLVQNKVVAKNGESMNGQAKGAVSSAFESAKQRFFSAVLVSLGLQTAIDDARVRLENGDSVIFQLTSTNEATQERALANKDDHSELDDLDMSPRELLLTYLRTSYPTALYEEYVDAGTGERRSRAVTLPDGTPVENPEAVKMRDELIEKVTNLVVMDGALDQILEAFGYENVAEITGRKRRVVRKMDRGEIRRVVDVRSSSSIVNETEAFMNGEKRVLVFSGAGDTGRSYHCDLGCKNQGRRIHYVLEPGWRAERTLQGMFRSHRTNQRVAPHYVIVPTDVPAQARFTSTIAKRLDQLGAMTRGQRDAASSGLYSAAENLESFYATDALRSLVHDIANKKIAAVTKQQFEDETGFKIGVDGDMSKITVTRFLNRLLAVSLDRQGVLLDEFLRRTQSIIEDAVAKGTYDAGVETIKPLALRSLSLDTLAVCEKTGARTELVKLEREDYEEFIPYAAALSRVKNYRKIHGNNSAMFGVDETGEVFALLTFTNVRDNGRLGTSHRVLKPVGPSRVCDYFYTAKYLSDEEAKRLWTDALKNRQIIKRSFYVVTGALLPVWDKLPQTLPRVYRMQTEQGERLLGRVLEDAEVERVLEVFGLTKSVWSTSDMYRKVRIGKVVALSRRHSLRLSRVNGSSRIEVTTDDPYSDSRFFKSLGLLEEKIGFRYRFFIPTGTNEESLFETLFETLSQKSA